MFILGSERDADVTAAFAKYAAYLADNRSRFPASAYSLATSNWYFGFSDHKAPHDAWLEAVTIAESPEEARVASITIKLLGAYHDGHILLHYPRVLEYQIGGVHLGQGHGDWRYDEFTVDSAGRLVHEIEWATFGAGSTWRIVASDVFHKWLPFPEAQQGPQADSPAFGGPAA